MKLTTTKLKKIIAEELMNETQKALGLPHVFSNLDLAKRIFAAIREGAPYDTIEGLRDIALNRIKLTRRDIGQGIDAENKTQEDFFLQHAVDEIDKSRGDYDMSINRSSFDATTKSEMGIPDEGPYAGYALNRRAQQKHRKDYEDMYRHAAEQRALRKAGKKYIPYTLDRFEDDDLFENLQYEGDSSILERFRGAAMKEAKLNPTFFLDIEGRQTFIDRVLADPEVDPRIKTTLRRALDNPTEDWAKADIDNVDMMIRSLYPKYAEELDRYDSHQGSLGYTREFEDFYKDARSRAKEEPPGLTESLMFEGDDSILEHFHGATLEEGGMVCGACLFEHLQEASCGCPNLLGEAEYQGRKVTLNKPMRGDVKKFKVYVKDPKTGNVKKVNFGDPNMKIKKSNPKRRKSFRARHNCDNPGPKTKARYWSCKKW